MSNTKRAAEGGACAYPSKNKNPPTFLGLEQQLANLRERRERAIEKMYIALDAGDRIAVHCFRAAITGLDEEINDISRTWIALANKLVQDRERKRASERSKQ